MEVEGDVEEYAVDDYGGDEIGYDEASTGVCGYEMQGHDGEWLT